MPTEEDRDLLARFVEGDDEAFEALVVRYEARIRNLAFGFVRDMGLAEDIAQESFLQAYRKAHTFRNEGSVKNWLYRIAVNRAQDELRRRSRRSEVELSADANEAGQGSGEELAANLEGIRHVASALEQMRAEHRIPLVLREVEGMSYQEMADTLEWPLGTVQTRVHRARLELRAALRGERGAT